MRHNEFHIHSGGYQRRVVSGQVANVGKGCWLILLGGFVLFCVCPFLVGVIR